MASTKTKALTLIALALLVALTTACSRKQREFATRPVREPELSNNPASTVEAVQVTPGAGALPSVGMVPEPSPPPQVYRVQPGDSLSAIAARFGTDVQALSRANGISDPNSLIVGQELQIPSPQIETGPAVPLLPDSEFVYGPAYANFDVAAFVDSQGGYLAGYSEAVGGEMLTGAEIVILVAHHYGVGPRLLLALLELRSGWVTSASPQWPPLGRNGSGSDSFSRQLAWAADQLNQGYYDWRGRGMQLITWQDGTATRYAPTLNAGTAGLQYFFSLYAGRSEWQALVGDGADSFLAVYRRLFGDPAQYAVEPLIPAGAASPALSLPWSEGEVWHFTGGPHGAWEDGSAWAALDFVPTGGPFGCSVPDAWAAAAADGLVIYSQDGEVMIDLDGDGYEQTGWVLFYLHMASDGRVPAGTNVKQGDPIGHPSCEGGFSESAHLHFARRYNGEWIAADGPLPMVLSGWQVHSGGAQYDGTMTRGRETRTAAELWDPAYNGLTHEE